MAPETRAPYQQPDRRGGCLTFGIADEGIVEAFAGHHIVDGLARNETGRICGCARGKDFVVRDDRIRNAVAFMEFQASSGKTFKPIGYSIQQIAAIAL